MLTSMFAVPECSGSLQVFVLDLPFQGGNTGSIPVGGTISFILRSKPFFLA